jgi:uncharacterized protein (DUF433 family)
MKIALIVCNPEILGGTPVFAGTRVPVKNLTDYLEHGDSIDEFLDDFPSVSREQVIRFFEEARASLTTACDAGVKSLDFKQHLLSMPDVGEDSLFARSPARNRPVSLP